ncbi:MAG: zinc-dependent alcohol dehydrogenase [Rhodospirillaceae bacterium]
MRGETMKAAVVHAFGEPLAIVDLPIPEPGPGQVLVKIRASGVCHTDLHAADGDWPVKPKLPLIPGHEGVGFVTAVGPDVHSVRIGDCVGVPWLHSACGECDYCATEWETLCKDQQNTGYTRNGTFAEYTLADADYVIPIPEGTELVEVAPILCAGVTVYNGLKRTEARKGQWVAISGIGGLGHMAVQYARLMGFKVAAVDIDDEKLQFATALGAALTVNGRTEDPGDVLQRRIGGAHGVLVTAASVKAYEQAYRMLRPGGCLTMLGLAAGTMALPVYDTVINAITVRGSVVGSRRIMREAMEFASHGRIKAAVRREKLENINQVLERLRRGDFEGRFVLDFGGPDFAYDDNDRIPPPQAWA